MLARIGAQLHAARRGRNLSRRELAELSGVSERFIALTEGGEANISVIRLAALAGAVGLSLSNIFAEDRPRGRRIALIGLRGAGKSTLGEAVAVRLGLPFIELNREIEAHSGIAVAEIFALYGDEGYRRLERDALEAVAAGHECAVLAVAGGIVSEPATYRRLLQSFTAIWLRAAPEEHMARVIAQGDRRPMAGSPTAMEDLRSILTAREALYAEAPLSLNTSGRSVEASTGDLAGLIAPIVG